jgi:xanthine dehydrogenase YagR molybdenum-binding subunit
MAEYAWPPAEKRKLIGKRISRVDGPQKVTGRAKYTYDVRRPGMLFGKIVRCPHAHARVKTIDTTAAEKLAGVRAIELMAEPGKEIFWAGDEVVALAAVDETTAEDAARAIRIEYEVLPHFVSDAEPPADIPEGGPLEEREIRDMLGTMQVPAGQVVSRIEREGVSFTPDQPKLDQLKQAGVPDAVLEALRRAKVSPPGTTASPYKRVAAQTQGDPDKAFAEAEVVSEGLYGVPVITHCCLETHGAMSEWTDADHVLVHISTQNLSGIPGQMAEPLGIAATNIRARQDHIGGGFGSKFSADSWGIVTAKLSKKAGGKPVKIMLERSADQQVAGARPSAYARVKVGAKKDGTLLAWESRGWGT